MAFSISLRRNHRRRGDLFRDGQQWPKAAAAYRAHLAGKPDDAAIHIQLGHVLKQQGKLAEAADAYRESVRRLGEDVDGLIHFGDTLFALSRFREANEIYRRLYAARPDARVLRRLTLLADPSDTPDTTVLGAGSLIFTVQDLFGYLHAHPTLTGIQRVQAAIILHAIDAVGEDAHFVLGAPESRPDILLPGEFWRVDPATLRSAVRQASVDPIDHSRLRLLLTRCEATAVRVRPDADSTIIVSGAFWSYGNTVDRLLESRRKGIRLGFYLYDLIPLTHEVFCDAGLVHAFAAAVAEMAIVADFILTISDFTRDAVLAHLAATSGRDLPVVTVQLARCPPGGGTETRRPAVLDEIGDRPYVAYISTVEGRKNHLYVVEAWRRMMASGLDVPDLLFVGRMGWQIDALEEILQSTSWLGHRIRHVQDLSDPELNAVYAGCLFTVFTSFAEGWGLPIGESLSLGRPCVASRVTSIPEVGGDLVDYVDPTDLEDGVAVLRRMIVDDDYRAARCTSIAQRFVERSWTDVGRDFVSTVQSLVRAGGMPARLPDLPEARLIAVDDASMKIARGGRDVSPIGLVFDAFYPPQGEGMWMRGLRGRLRLTGRCAPGEPCVIALGLIVAPWNSGGRLTISSTSPAADSMPLILSIGDLDGSRTVTWKASADARGVLEIELACDGILGGPPDDPRRFAVGLSAIGYWRGEDMSGLPDIAPAAG